MSGARPGQGWAAPRSGGPVVLVAQVGEASGSKPAAAALACAASEPDRAALLIDLDEGRAPRPSLIATAGARALEQRLSVHMPDAPVASRGSICRLKLTAGDGDIERIAAALPLVRESAAIVHLPPGRLRPVLEEPRIRPTAALLRADLSRDRSLTALAARDLIDRGLRVAVLKQPPNPVISRLALLGALPAPGWVFPTGLHARLLVA
ncbi:MAG TPA: hypothetical protein VFT19_11295 [Solirubrobacterales bacterium]|nr:hypothetical protein [Solirubrobacterales bacterium]